jgi:5'-nucleotidase/UDP-sugar diphosphatase
METPMKALSTVVSRRMVLASLGAVPLAAALPRVSFGQDRKPVAQLVSLADLHSPYRQLPRILTAIRDIKAASPDVPLAILINGDIFERGNVVALRSGAVADWAFLEALAAEGPVVVNLGNHETAILDDMAEFVSRATEIGITVIGNLVDARSGNFYAPVSTQLELGGQTLALVGLAATNPFVYREPIRPTLAFIDPVTFATQNLPSIFGAADIPVLMSHSGVTPDRAILASIETPALVIGAHDHLTLDHEAGDVRYFHGGSWGSQLRHVHLHADGPRFEVETVAIEPSIAADAALEALIREQMDAHLTEEDREVIVERESALDLASSILVAVEAVRAATDADIAMLGHTTFGQALPAGPLTAYDFDAFVRFGGDLTVAEVDGATLSEILRLANQHQAASLDQRTGDFVYANEVAIEPDATYRLAVNGWTAMNQQSYLGTSDLVFTPVPDLELKAVVRQALADGA